MVGSKDCASYRDGAVGCAAVEPGLLGWVPWFTGGDWHPAKKATVAQNKWLSRSLRIGESINSATVPADAQVRAKPQWCQLRQIVFGRTQVQFPFRVRSDRKLSTSQPLVLNVFANAFFDIGHAPADHTNGRTDLEG